MQTVMITTVLLVTGSSKNYRVKLHGCGINILYLLTGPIKHYAIQNTSSTRPSSPQVVMLSAGWTDVFCQHDPNMLWISEW